VKLRKGEPSERKSLEGKRLRRRAQLNKKGKTKVDLNLIEENEVGHGKGKISQSLLKKVRPRLFSLSPYYVHPTTEYGEKKGEKVTIT